MLVCKGELSNDKSNHNKNNNDDNTKLKKETRLSSLPNIPTHEQTNQLLVVALGADCEMGCICSGGGVGASGGSADDDRGFGQQRQRARHIDSDGSASIPFVDTNDNGVVGSSSLVARGDGDSFAGGATTTQNLVSDDDRSSRTDCAGETRELHNMMTNNKEQYQHEQHKRHKQHRNDQHQQPQQNQHQTSKQNHRQFVSQFLSKLMYGRRSFQSAVRIEACDEFGNKTSVRRAGEGHSGHNQSKRKSHSSESSGCGGSQVSCESSPHLSGAKNFLDPSQPVRARAKKRKSLVDIAYGSDEKVKGPTIMQATSENRDSIASTPILQSSSKSDPLNEPAIHPQEINKIPLQVNNNDHNSNNNISIKNEQSDNDDVQLFTSAQQLCFKIIKEKLLPQKTGLEGRLLCLFIFGFQGSSKGEIAFDLVDHSNLLLHLRRAEEHSDQQPATVAQDDSDCPLYHYLDVADLIVAHIDERIQQYNELVAGTLRQRKRQLALKINDENEDSKTDSGDQSNFEDNDRGEDEDDESNKSEKNLSITSQRSTSIDGQSIQSGDSFGLVTLSTKKRSILQLKLMKYYNSVTIKWIFDLIEQEIEKLESRIDNFKDLATRDRVYCINLVPNQLSLFKTCLYLQQNLLLRDFKYPFWAIKFERRTNIKLVNKEKIGEGNEQANLPNTPQGSSRRPMKIYNFRVPRLHIQHLDFNKTQANFPQSKLKSPSSAVEKRQDDIEGTIVMAADVITNRLNEKLGPKYSEYFIKQFKVLNKLIRLRYNPLRNYNYANDDYDNWPSEAASNSNVASSKQCCSKLWSQESEEIVDGDTLLPLPHGDRILSSSMQNLLKIDDTDQIQNQKEPRLSLTDTSRIPLNERRGKLSPLSVGIDSAASSVSSLLSSEGSTIAESPQDYNRRVIGLGSTTASSNHRSFIKWAIELELVNLSSDQRERQTTRLVPEDSVRESMVQITYQPPESLTRSSTRSPLMFAQHQKYSPSYHLIPVFVAYANGQAQLMYEVKREHQRVLRLRSLADLQRLFKLILKAEHQLLTDCDDWLYASILKQHPDLNHSANTATKNLPKPRQRRSVAALNIPPSIESGAKLPSLIVYTIKVDIQRITTGRFKFPPKFDFDFPQPQLTLSTTTLPSTKTNSSGEESSQRKSLAGRHQAPILTGGSNLLEARTGISLSLPQDASILSRPQSANLTTNETSPIQSRLRPSSSRAATSQVLAKPKRHVQFRLNQAPIFYGSGKQRSQQPVQKRKWIRDTLFTSCSNDSIGELLNPVAGIIKFGLTEASENQNERLIKYDNSDS